MTKPTREQVIEWAREANFDVSTLNSIDGEEAQCDSCKVILTDQLQRLCALAMSAGREQGLREAKEVCDDHKADWGENANGCTSGMYDFMSDAAEQCAAAIEQLRGE